MTLTATTPAPTILEAGRLRTMPLLEALQAYTAATGQPLPTQLPADLEALPPFPHYNTYGGLVLSCSYQWDDLRGSHVADAVTEAWLRQCYADLVAIAHRLSIPEQSTPAHAQYA